MFANCNYKALDCCLKVQCRFIKSAANHAISELRPRDNSKQFKATTVMSEATEKSTADDVQTIGMK